MPNFWEQYGNADCSKCDNRAACDADDNYECNFEGYADGDE